MNGEIGSSIMCRACMKVDGVLLPIYGDYSISKNNFSDKLADLASIQIDKYDGLPSVLCTKCAYRTEAFHEFKLQVQATEKKLRKMFQCPIECDVSTKSELVWKNSKIDDNCLPDDTHEAENYPERCEIILDEKIEEIDVKPIMANESSDETAILERRDSSEEMRIFDSLNFVDNDEDDCANSERIDDDFTSKNEIFITATTGGSDNVDTENLQIIKHEMSNDIKDIIHSQDASYVLLYISEENEIDEATSSRNESANIGEQNEAIGQSQTNERIFDVSSCDEKSPMETLNDSNNSQNHRDSEDMAIASENVDSRVIMENSDTTRILNSPSDIRGISQKEQNKTTTTTTPMTMSHETDSESDNFIDYEDNLVGSLNDTITRIKEIKTNDQLTLFQCTLCMENYEKLTAILAHTVDTHVPRDGPFFCVVCEKDCPSHRELRSHVKCHSGKYPYTCFVCNKSYSMKRYLKRHMSCHTDLPRHRCPKCGERFALKNELETHLGTHVYIGPPFACSQCPRVFNHKGNYKRHLISHLDPRGLHLPKYPCEICGKRFLNNRTLQTHVRVHTGEKPFECDICKRSFSQRGNLLNHQKIHFNPRSYTCEVCGKSFNQRSTLRDHGLLHTGEKPYVCNVCGVAFTFSAALRRHMWSHETDKPFGCEICNARFVGKYDIKRHMKIHSDRPKTRRKRRTRKDSAAAVVAVVADTDAAGEGNETIYEIGENDGIVDENETKIFIEEVLFIEDSEVIGGREEEAEKENVDVLLNLIDYG